MSSYSSKELVIESAKERKTISSEYLLAYILPLFAFDFTRWDSLILFGLFFLTLGYLCVKHRNVSTNILLEIMGYNIYDCVFYQECNEDIKVERVVISRNKCTSLKNRIVKLCELNNEYCFIPDVQDGTI